LTDRVAFAPKAGAVLAAALTARNAGSVRWPCIGGSLCCVAGMQDRRTARSWAAQRAASGTVTVVRAGVINEVAWMYSRPPYLL